VTAWCSNGDVNPVIEHFEDEAKARSTADWMHNNPGLMNVTLEAPFGVRLIQANGEDVTEHHPDIHVINKVAASWRNVVANRKFNRTRIRRVEVLNAPVRTAVATAQDLALSEAMMNVLEDAKILPSIKFDINRWFDSKVWQ
jgi:hypothetical protein